MSVDVEKWMPTRGTYEVSNLGRVRHRSSETVRALRVDPTGYYALNIWEAGRLVRCKVHLLVLTAFSGPRPDGLVARHLNGNPLDNRSVNLCWGTASENCADRVRHGTALLGTRNHKAKLTEDQVLAIRESVGTCRSVGRSFGVSAVMVSRIRRRSAWAWL